MESTAANRGSARAMDNMKQILLVEDNEEDSNQLKEMIEARGDSIQIEAVTTGTDAVSFFESHAVDCVLLDYRLEVEDGIDILRQLKAIRPLAPIIMLTGQGNEEVAATAIKEGASDYLIIHRETETSLRTAIENAISRAALEEKIADQEYQRRQFLNILVHDLRAPLRNVQQLGEFALKDIDLVEPSELKQLIMLQNKAARRATELIGSLEAYALLDKEIALTQISLSDAANDARDNLAWTITERQASVEIGKALA
jgi:CheY-like chemotaxis protein